MDVDDTGHQPSNFLPVQDELDVLFEGRLPDVHCYGDGMVHAFTLDDERLSHRNPWVRTTRFLEERTAGAPLCRFPDHQGRANTNIIHHAGELMVLEEAHPPLAICPTTLRTFNRARQGGPAFVWDPTLGASLALQPRGGTGRDIAWIEAPAKYAFHVTNAWEADGCVHLDVMRYDEPPRFPRAEGVPATPWRWTIAADRAESLRVTRLSDVGYRTGEHPLFGLAPHDRISEPVFVPRTPDAAPDDGWLLAVLWSARRRGSDLLVFETDAIETAPVARAALPCRVPFGFHGNWVGQDTLGEGASA